MIESDTAVANLSADEKRIETLTLRTNARITASNAAGWRSAVVEWPPRSTLKYAANGEVLEHAVITGRRSHPTGGRERQAGPANRGAARSTSRSAPDGSTPTALTARDRVELTMPAEPGVAERTIKANALDAKGEPGRGLTRALFTGERPLSRTRRRSVDRGATSGGAGRRPETRPEHDRRRPFSRNVRFEDGSMFALAASARYDIDKGIAGAERVRAGRARPARRQRADHGRREERRRRRWKARW